MSADHSPELKLSVLAGVPRSAPAIARAEGLRDAAARVGFDWPNADEVFAKVDEEVAELKDAKSLEDQREELGDLLFALINLAHHLGFSADDALQQANDKFTRRFQAIEAACSTRGLWPAQLTLAELDALWDEAKLAEHE